MWDRGWPAAIQVTQQGHFWRPRRSKTTALELFCFPPSAPCSNPKFAACSLNLPLCLRGFAQPCGSGCCRAVASSQGSPAHSLCTSAWDWGVQRVRCQEAELLGTFPAAFHPYTSGQEFLQLLEVLLPWQGLFPFIPLSSIWRQRAGCNSNLHTINFCRFYSPHWSGIKQHLWELGMVVLAAALGWALPHTSHLPSLQLGQPWDGQEVGTAQPASSIDDWIIF